MSNAEKREAARALRLAASQAATRTGLTVDTCMNLLNCGWTLREDIRQVTVWLGPAAQLTDVK